MLYEDALIVRQVVEQFYRIQKSDPAAARLPSSDPRSLRRIMQAIVILDRQIVSAE